MQCAWFFFFVSMLSKADVLTFTSAPFLWWPFQICLPVSFPSKGEAFWLHRTWHKGMPPAEAHPNGSKEQNALLHLLSNLPHRKRALRCCAFPNSSPGMPRLTSAPSLMESLMDKQDDGKCKAQELKTAVAAQGNSMRARPKALPITWKETHKKLFWKSDP